jgi:DUF4097 and DUF4098 domain-containing protein YvlB
MSPQLRLAGHRWAAGLFFAAVVLAGAQPAAARRLEKRFTVDGRPMVMLRNAEGRIQVKSWQRSEVEILADHASDRIEVDATQNGNRIEVRTHALEPGVSAVELQANYEIHVPEETELEIKNDSGSVTVERIYSDITIDTVLSTVELTNVSGVLTVHTVGGSFTCSRCVGRIDFSSTSGAARFLQSTSQFVRAQTLSGDLFYDGGFRPNGNYLLKTTTGRIDVLISDKDSVKLSARSVQGTVENQINLKPEAHPLLHFGGVGSSLVGTTGKGLARVELTSFSGKIRIRKRD